MQNLVYISLTSLIDQSEAKNIFQYAFSGQLYQEKMLKGFSFKKVFSFNIHIKKTSSKKQIGDVTYYQYPLNKWMRYTYIIKFIRSINKQIQKEDSILFYNIYHRTIPIFLFYKYVRKLKVYVLLADYEAPQKSFLNNLFHQLLKKSDGILSLSPNIKLHPNTIVQELLIEDYKAKPTPTISDEYKRNILFSGTISSDTGIQLAIEAMKYLPEYKLHISGSLYKITDTEMKKILENPLINAVYHGKLERDEYYNLLDKCLICLSLRNIYNEDHLYNFPSKIGEYLYHKKIVISTLKYAGFENFVTYSEWDAEALALVIKNAKVNNDATTWLLKNFGLDKFKQNILKLMNYKH